MKIYHADKVVKDVETSANDAFEAALDPGEYKIEITATDFEPHIETVNVTPSLAPFFGRFHMLCRRGLTAYSFIVCSQ